jgi:hypothetical protein
MLRTHLADCEGTCPGCQPCPERHCGVCGREHVTVEGRGSDLTCVDCLRQCREDLQQVEELAALTPTEAVHRGINSEAAMLAGPTPDTPEQIEAFGHRNLARIGIDGKGLEVDERHPLWMLGTWEQLVRQHLDQPAPGEEKITIPGARAYLDRVLHVLAHDDWFAFEELARDARQCRARLEDVLHAGEREERGAPCHLCGRAHLVKAYGDEPADDRWTCPKCEQWFDEETYRSKVDGVYVQTADRLTASQIATTYRVPEGSVRAWASLGKVRRRGKDHLGRVLYDVADVVAKRDGVSA